MKNIRLKYHKDTGIRMSPEINLIQNYIHYDEDKCYNTFPFSNLYDYINWLEDQIDKSGKIIIDAKKLQKELMKL